MGSGRARLVYRHLIPNALSVVIVNVTFLVADSILALAYLGFLGFGLQYPAASWGDMLGNADTYISNGQWWLVYPVGVLPGGGRDGLQPGRRRAARRARRAAGGDAVDAGVTNGTPRALEVTNLSTHIKLTRSTVQAVGNVDLGIDAGETLGLVGESGCGKSMLGLSILGLLPKGGKIIEGSVQLGGRELVGLRDAELRKLRGNELAMIFQDSQSSLNPTKTIGEQVAEPVRLHRGASRREAHDRALEVLELVGTAPAEGAPGQLPAPALGRAAAAGDDRDRARLRAEGSARRRADHRARRDHPGADPCAARRPRGSPGDGDAAGHARHGRRRRPQPTAINVMYAGRIVETGPTKELFGAHAPSLHAGAARLDPAARVRTTARRWSASAGLPPDLTNPPAGCRFAPRCPRATDQCRAEEPPLTGRTRRTCSRAGTRSTAPVVEPPTDRAVVSRPPPPRPRRAYERPPARDRGRGPRVPGHRRRGAPAQGRLGQGRLRT